MKEKTLRCFHSYTLVKFEKKAKIRRNRRTNTPKEQKSSLFATEKKLCEVREKVKCSEEKKGENSTKLIKTEMKKYFPLRISLREKKFIGINLHNIKKKEVNRPNSPYFFASFSVFVNFFYNNYTLHFTLLILQLISITNATPRLCDRVQ